MDESVMQQVVQFYTCEGDDLCLLSADFKSLQQAGKIHHRWLWESIRWVLKSLFTLHRYNEILHWRWFVPSYWYATRRNNIECVEFILQICKFCWFFIILFLYIRLNSSGVTWEDANMTCAQHNATLPQIKSYEDLEMLFDYVRVHHHIILQDEVYDFPCCTKTFPALQIIFIQKSSLHVCIYIFLTTRSMNLLTQTPLAVLFVSAIVTRTLLHSWCPMTQYWYSMLHSIYRREMRRRWYSVIMVKWQYLAGLVLGANTRDNLDLVLRVITKGPLHFKIDKYRMPKLAMVAMGMTAAVTMTMTPTMKAVVMTRKTGTIVFVYFTLHYSALRGYNIFS